PSRRVGAGQYWHALRARSRRRPPSAGYAERRAVGERRSRCHRGGQRRGSVGCRSGQPHSRCRARRRRIPNRLPGHLGGHRQPPQTGGKLMRLLSYIAGRVGARIRRAPGLHFLLLGALLFAAQGWRTPASAPPKRAPIVLSAADLERWRREWPARAGIDAPPPRDAVFVDAAIDDAVLRRAALDRAYDRRDPVVRARLLTRGRYLGLAVGGGDEAIEREARALGLQRSDEVVRRHLVEMMRLAAAKAGPGDLPTEAD